MGERVSERDYDQIEFIKALNLDRSEFDMDDMTGSRNIASGSPTEKRVTNAQRSLSNTQMNTMIVNSSRSSLFANKKKPLEPVHNNFILSSRDREPVENITVPQKMLNAEEDVLSPDFPK